MFDEKHTDPVRVTTNPKPYTKTHARYAGMLLAGVGLVANVTAITGLILSHANVVVISAAILAILCGLYFLLKRWGKPVGWYTLLAVVIIVAGSVMLSLALEARSRSGTHDSDTSYSPGSGSTNSSSDAPSDGTPVSKNTNHTVVFEKDFKLTSQEGLELDDEKGRVYQQQSTAKAPIDLYLSGYPGFSASIKKLYTYQPPAQPTGSADKDEYTACRNLVDNSQLGVSTVLATQVVPGAQYCSITSQGRIALVTMKEMIDAGYDSTKSTASFTVKLWN